MQLFFVIVLSLLGLVYPMMVCVWLLRDKTQPRQSDILSALCVLTAAPFFLFAGIFFNSFGDNICYSYLIGRMAELPERYAITDVSTLGHRFAADVKSLPLRGYETSCEQVSAAVELLLQNARSPRQ